jgi:hypothetical protein
LNTDNFSTFFQIFSFQIRFEVDKKSERFQAFFSYRGFFQKPMLGSPTQSLRHLFEFFVFAYWLKDKLKMCQPIGEDKKMSK